MQGIRSKHSAESLATVTLTKREEEILELVAQGLTSNEIADRLFISPRTVETHRAHLMEKLGAKNAAALVRYAVLHSVYFPGDRRPFGCIICRERMLMPMCPFRSCSREIT